MKMKVANKVLFQVPDSGNGYGQLLGSFGEGEDGQTKELGLIFRYDDESYVATIVSMIEQYQPTMPSDELQVRLIMAKAKMRHCINEYDKLLQQMKGVKNGKADT